jgi:hypothetical protein
MMNLRYTLLSEGTSDKALVPIMTWLLQQHLVEYAIQSAWADLAKLPRPPQNLTQKIKMAVDLYPCEVLFIHRDADNQGLEHRIQEIENAVNRLDTPFKLPIIRVIPVRMTEAWLLFEETAIRMAASNPRGRINLTLPSLKTVEQIADPKVKLHETLRKASELSGRRLKKFRPNIYRVAELIQDFSPLRELSAFQSLEAEVREFAGSIGNTGCGPAGC